MSKVAALTPVAGKMLLRLLEIGGENESQDELMEAAGIGSRSQFFKAKAQLKGLGLLDDEGNVNFIVAASVPRRVDPRSFIAQSLAAQPIVVPPEFEMWPPQEEEEPVLKGSLRGQAMQADQMPSDGNPAQRGSNFQSRRRVQIAVLAATFKDLFGYSLAPSAAKELLVLSGDSAEEVLDAAETTKAQPKEITSPVGYIRKILQRRKEEAARGGGDDDGIAKEDEYKPDARSARIAALLQRRGMLEDDDDDGE